MTKAEANAEVLFSRQEENGLVEVKFSGDLPEAETLLKWEIFFTPAGQARFSSPGRKKMAWLKLNSLAIFLRLKHCLNGRYFSPRPERPNKNFD